MVEANVPETLISLPSIGIGAASADVVEVSERCGYTVGATAAGTFRLVRTYRPTWAIIAAIATTPIFGLGLFFLQIRRTDSGTISIYEDREGTKARIVGLIDTEVIEYLSRAPRTESLRSSPQSDRLGAPPPLPPRASRTGVVPDHGLDSTVNRPRTAHRTMSFEIRLPDGRSFAVGRGLVLGRAPLAQGEHAGKQPLPYPDASLSKTHVAIAADTQGVLVTDLHSTNGTAVRSLGAVSHCPPGQAITAPSGAEIIAGDTVIKILASS